MATKSLCSLPTETIQHIAAQGLGLRDLSCLSRANRRLYEAIHMSVYQLDANRLMPYALIWSALHGEKNTMERALVAGSNVNSILGDSVAFDTGKAGSPKAFYGNDTTPLMGAAGRGHMELVKRLLSVGATVEWVDEFGRNALHLAATEGRREIVELLMYDQENLLYAEALDRGLPVNCAAHDEGIFRLMLECMHPAMRASALEDAAKRGYREIFYWLIDHGVEIDLDRFRRGTETLLSTLCGNESVSFVNAVDIASCLIDSGMDISGQDARMRPSVAPLLKACRRKDEGAAEMVTWLLGKGAPRRVTSAGGDQTALSTACLNGSVRLVKLLLEDTQSELPYSEDQIDKIQECACLSGNEELLDIIMSEFPQRWPGDDKLEEAIMHAACLSGNANIVRKLLTSRRLSHYTEKLLNCAWHQSNAVLLETLLYATGLAQVKDLLNNAIFMDSGTPATFDDKKRLECFHVLIGFGIDPTQGDAKDLTFLHGACLVGAISCVELLLDEYNMDVNANSAWHGTPIIFAIKGNHQAVMDLLIARGANVIMGPTASRDTNRTPMGYALQSINGDALVNRLLDCGVGPTVSVNCDDDVEPEDTPLEALAGRLRSGLTRTTHMAASNQLAERLLELKPSPLERALRLACRQNHFSLARFLLERSASPNKEARHDATTLLSIASSRGATCIVKLLLSFGANVNTRGQIAPALERAISFNSGVASAACVQALVEAGADVGTEPDDSDANTPALINAFGAHANFVKLLSFCPNSSVLRTLLDKGGLQATIRTSWWNDIFVAAFSAGNSSFMRILVGRGLVDLEALDSVVMLEILLDSVISTPIAKDTYKHLLAEQRAAMESQAG